MFNIKRSRVVVNHGSIRRQFKLYIVVLTYLIQFSREFVQIDAPDYSKRESYVSAHGEDRDHVRFVLRPETHNGHTNINNEL